MPGPAETQIGYGRNWANASNTPFREYKHWVHEGGIATPLVAHWPKGITVKNSWNHVPTHLIDIMATALDLAEEADLHFELGVKAYSRRDYSTALEHLLRSNRLAPNKNVVYNIADVVNKIAFGVIIWTVAVAETDGDS